MIVFRKHFLLLLVGVLLLSAAATLRAAGESPDPLAVVDGKAITSADFVAEMAHRVGEFDSLEQKQILLEEMVRTELAYAAATRKGYENKLEIQTRLKQLLVNMFRRDMLEPRLDGLTVTGDELSRYYQKHRNDFMRPAKVRVAVIRISVPANASEEKRAQLAQRARSARAEALALDAAARSFGGVAVKYSDHQSTRYRGGDTGWLQRNGRDSRWETKVLQAFSSLTRIGQISPIITTPTGHYIAKLMDMKAPEIVPLESVRNRIYHILMRDKKKQIEQAFFSGLKSMINVKVYPERLEGIVDTPKASEREHPPLPR